MGGMKYELSKIQTRVGCFNLDNRKHNRDNIGFIWIYFT